MNVAHLVACHDCDLLQRRRPLPEGGKALCGRCGAVLYRSHPRGNERALALALAGLFLFILANYFPIATLILGGERVEATLYGAVRHLYRTEMRLLAGMVFVTMILMPSIQLAAMCWLLMPLRRGHVPQARTLAYRALEVARTWGMVEVFVLGVLVTLVKLAHVADAIPGVALGSFGALMLVITAAGLSFDEEELWSRA